LELRSGPRHELAGRSVWRYCRSNALFAPQVVIAKPAEMIRLFLLETPVSAFPEGFRSAPEALPPTFVLLDPDR